MAEEMSFSITDPMSALIFGSVPAQYWGYIRHACPEPDLIIAADGGVNCARSAGYEPHLLVGDWDSGGAPEENITSVSLPTEKDLTDLQAAAELALERGCERLFFTACVGGRLDQTLANLHLLEWVYDRGGEGYLLDEGNQVQFWDGKPLVVERDNWYRYLSIIPLDRAVTGVTLAGVKYPLKGATVERGGTLTVSNEIAGPAARLSAESGRMLLIRSRKYNF